jgi:hypothetical protein
LFYLLEVSDYIDRESKAVNSEGVGSFRLILLQNLAEGTGIFVRLPYNKSSVGYGLFITTEEKRCLKE